MATQERVEQTVRENTGLVSLLVGRMMRLFPRLPSGIDREDLESFGYLGLVQAARAYDPARGVAFSTYAYHCIENTIRAQLQRASRREFDCLSLDALVGDDEDGTPLAELIPDESANAERQALDSAEQDVLRRTVRTLPPRLAEIIQDLYFAQHSAAEVARRHGLTTQRVQALHRQGLTALRRRLREGQVLA
jgi:RNA polymerase sigma factor for flagellar operon FliA